MVVMLFLEVWIPVVIPKLLHYDMPVAGRKIARISRYKRMRTSRDVDGLRDQV